jgi:hypothetical protein
LDPTHPAARLAAAQLAAVAALINDCRCPIECCGRITECYGRTTIVALPHNLASLPPYPLCLHHATNGEASNNPQKEYTKLQAYCATHCTLHFTRSGKREENTRIHGSYGVTVCCWRRRRRREPNLIDLYLLYYNIYTCTFTLYATRVELELGPGSGAGSGVPGAPGAWRRQVI